MAGISLYGAKNPAWRGGRIVASNGYVILRMPGHHLADVRGYVYEHRLVAEGKIGRRLVKGEQVHHADGNKQNNSPDNIVVAASLADHKVHHRKHDNYKGSQMRMPSEPNPMVDCRCGCGLQLLRFDSRGRPRHFVVGHSMMRDRATGCVLSRIIGGAVDK